jgi:hypothetical protein
MGKSKWMPFAEAVTRAGSLKDLLVALRERRVFARCAEWRTWPDGGSTKPSDRNIHPTSWNDAHDIDPAAGWAVFTFVLYGTLEDDKHDVTYELLAIGLEVERGGVDKLWPLVAPEPPPPASDAAPPQPTGTSTDATSPTPEVKMARRRRGRTVEHPWEEAAGYVDERVKEVGPLERDPDGVPIVQRGIDLMVKGFKKDPKPPSERQIRDWINDHPSRTSKWWDDDK